MNVARVISPFFGLALAIIGVAEWMELLRLSICDKMRCSYGWPITYTDYVHSYCAMYTSLRQSIDELRRRSRKNLPHCSVPSVKNTVVFS